MTVKQDSGRTVPVSVTVAVTVQYSAVQYRIMQYDSLQCSAVNNSKVQHSNSILMHLRMRR